MTSKDLGLIEKYRVERTDGKPVDWCFVLEGKDPLAWPALLTYAEMAEGAGYLQLAVDLRAKVTELGIGPGPQPRMWDDGRRAVDDGSAGLPDRGGQEVFTTQDLAEISGDQNERKEAEHDG